MRPSFSNSYQIYFPPPPFMLLVLLGIFPDCFIGVAYREAQCGAG